MATYLLAWNPKRWKWEDLAEQSEEVQSGTLVKDRWSCGANKQIKKGDRIFLVRLGEEPKGIMASGIALTDAYKDLHWEADKAKAGKTGMFVEVEFDILLNPDTDVIVPREMLNDMRFSRMHWDTQMSGVRIPDDIACALEKVWTDFSTNPDVTLPEEVTITKIMYEGATKKISVNSYERNPEARRQCIKHYGTACTVCDVDFGATYGKVGAGLIHVHHLKELSEIGKEYKVDPMGDLRPVCPNCHAIIHRRKPAYSISDVKEYIRQAKK